MTTDEIADEIRAREGKLAALRKLAASMPPPAKRAGWWLIDTGYPVHGKPVYYYGTTLEKAPGAFSATGQTCVILWGVY